MNVRFLAAAALALLLHPAAGEVTVDPSDIDCGISRVGRAITCSVGFTNAGARPVTLSIGSLPGDTFSFRFTTSIPGTRLLPPGTSHTAVLTFHPTSEGLVSGDLVILTDDPAQPELRIPVTAEGSDEPYLHAGGPILLWAPFGLGGSGTFDISNQGNSDLHWSSAGVGAGGDWWEAAFEGLAEPEVPALLKSIVPNRLDFPIAGASGALDNTTTPDLYPAAGGNRLNIGGQTLSYARGELDTGAKYTFVSTDGLLVWVTALDDEGSVGVTGALRAVTGRAASSSGFEFTLSSRILKAFTKSVYAGGEPSVNHLWVTDSATATHSPSQDPADDADALGGLQSGSWVAYALFSTREATPPTEVTFRDLADVLAAHLLPVEMTLEPSSGTIAPGASQEVTTVVAPHRAWPRRAGYPHIARITSDAFNAPSAEVAIDFRATANSIFRDPTNPYLAPPSLRLSGLEGISTHSGVELEFTPEEGLNECPWSGTVSAPWVTISPSEGAAPNSVRIAVAPASTPRDGESAVVRIQPETGTPVWLPVDFETFPVKFSAIRAGDGAPFAVAIREGGLSANGAHLARIDPSTGSVIEGAAIGRTAASLAFDPDTGQAVVLERDELVTSTHRFGPRDWGVREHFVRNASWDLVALSGADEVSFGDVGSTSFVRSYPVTSDEQLAILAPLEPLVSIAGAPHKNLIVSAGHSAQRGSVLVKVEMGDTPINRFAHLATPVGPGFPLSVSQRAERLFWGPQVFDENLTPLGTLPEPVFACSPRGELAVTATGVRRLSSGGDSILTFPFETEISAVWGKAERVLIHNPDDGQTLSLPLRDYSITPVDFGAVPLGASAEAGVTITNHGVEPLTLTGLAGAPAGFDLLGLPVTIDPGGGQTTLIARLVAGATGDLSASGGTLIDTFLDGPERALAFTATGTFDAAGLPGYAAWQVAQFPADPAAPEAAPLADPDGDGWPNFAEYLFGLDPHATGDPGGHLPRVETNPDGALSFTFVRAEAAADHIALQQSGALATWTDATEGSDYSVASVEDLGGGYERVTVEFAAASGTRFLRAEARLLPR